MATLAALLTKNPGDPFGLTNYTQLKTNSDYLVVPGANLASATSITPTSEFHIVTGTTTIDTLNYASPAAGQQIRLLFQSALAVRNNGGGTGNIRTLGGGDRMFAANEVGTFVYDGAVWREVAPSETRGRTVGTYDLTSSNTKSSLISGATASASTGYLIPANTLGGNAPAVLRLGMRLDYLKNDSAGSTGAIEIAWGNTAIAALGSISWSSQSGTRSVMYLDMIVWASASGTIWCNGRWEGGSPAAPPTGLLGGGISQLFANTGAAIATNVDQFLDVRWTHSVSSALLSIRRQVSFWEVL